MMPPILGASFFFLPLITPREFAITAQDDPRSRHAADHLGCHVRLELVEPAVIEQGLEYRPHIVAHAMIDGDQPVQFFYVPLGPGYVRRDGVACAGGRMYSRMRTMQSLSSLAR